MTEQIAEVSQQFAYDVKIEQSAKGARVTVHARSNDYGEAMNQAAAMYVGMQRQLEALGQVVAPIEVAKGAKVE